MYSSRALAHIYINTHTHICNLGNPLLPSKLWWPRLKWWYPLQHVLSCLHTLETTQVHRTFISWIWMTSMLAGAQFQSAQSAHKTWFFRYLYQSAPSFDIHLRMKSVACTFSCLKERIFLSVSSLMHHHGLYVKTSIFFAGHFKKIIPQSFSSHISSPLSSVFLQSLFTFLKVFCFLYIMIN